MTFPGRSASVVLLISKGLQLAKLLFQVGPVFRTLLFMFDPPAKVLNHTAHRNVRRNNRVFNLPNILGSFQPKVDGFNLPSEYEGFISLQSS